MVAVMLPLHPILNTFFFGVPPAHVVRASTPFVLLTTTVLWYVSQVVIVPNYLIPSHYGRLYRFSLYQADI